MPNTPPTALQRVPPHIVSLADHERHAQQHLNANAWAYFAGGAADEITLQANNQAWNQLPLAPRVLRPLAGGHTRIELLGRTWAHPVLLAPVAFQRLAHPDGELASAYAAAALGAGLVLSTQASVALETIAQVVLADPGRGPLWFQLYLQHDRGFTRELVQRAEAAGYEALVLTVDAPTSGVRDRERRAGFHLPPGIRAVNLAGCPPAPTATPTKTAAPKPTPTKTTAKPAPKPTTKPVAKKSTYPALKKGSKGASVVTLQALLNSRNKAGLVRDGVFGPRTEKAVKAFQKKSKLKATGKLNDATWAKLLPVLKPGQKGASVKATQVELRAAGAKLTLTSKMDTKTVKAVKAYQKKKKISATGNVGPLTWAALLKK